MSCPAKLDDEQQAIRARCEALGLSFAHAQRLATATDQVGPQALLWVLGLNFATLAPIKPRRWLWMAAQTASVNYREILTPEALLTILTTGAVPAMFVPHVEHLLDEKPIQVVVMAVEQAAHQSGMLIDAIWRNVERITGMCSRRQTLWMVGE